MGHHGIPWASQMSQMNCLFACNGSHGSVMASSAEDLPEERRETFAVLAVLRVLRGLLCMNLLNFKDLMGSSSLKGFFLVQIAMILWRQLGIHSSK